MTVTFHQFFFWTKKPPWPWPWGQGGRIQSCFIEDMMQNKLSLKLMTRMRTPWGMPIHFLYPFHYYYHLLLFIYF